MTASNVPGGSMGQGVRACRRRPTLFFQTWPKGFFSLSRQIEEFRHLLCAHRWRIVFYRRQANTRHILPWGKHMVTVGWVGAPSERPRSEFMTQSLVLSIDVCRGLEPSPLRAKHPLEFSEPDLGPTSGPELCFSRFPKSLELLV